MDSGLHIFLRTIRQFDKFYLLSRNPGRYQDQQMKEVSCSFPDPDVGAYESIRVLLLKPERPTPVPPARSWHQALQNERGVGRKIPGADKHDPIGDEGFCDKPEEVAEKECVL